MVYLPPSPSEGWDLTAGVMLLRPWALVPLKMNCNRMVKGLRWTDTAHGKLYVTRVFLQGS